jgi:hypothetical protein
MERRRLAHLGGPRQQRQGGRRRRRAALAGRGREGIGVRADRRGARAGPRRFRLLGAGRPPPALQRIHLLARGQSTLDTDAQRALRIAAAAYVGIGTEIVITGYADKSGNAAANVDLAKKARPRPRARRAREARRRAKRIGSQPPASVTAGGKDDEGAPRRPRSNALADTMFTRFFIERPIFAAVVAIIIALARRRLDCCCCR